MTPPVPPAVPYAAPRVAFQGELGAFSEEAIIRLWNGEAHPVPCREFVDVVTAVCAGDVELGLLPVENTLAGTVIGSYDALTAHPAVHVVAETVVPIHHALLGAAGATIDMVRTVASHPVALAQCGAFLQRLRRQHPQLEVRAAYDTAGAARDVARRGDLSAAAIAGRAAAARYALTILAADVEDRGDNQTRFWAIGRAPALLEPGTAARTALEVTAENAPGALHRVLAPIAGRGLNLSKLESRPTGEPWRYRFFLELEHAAGDGDAAAAIGEIRRLATSVRVVGTFAVAR